MDEHRRIAGRVGAKRARVLATLVALVATGAIAALASGAPGEPAFDPPAYRNPVMTGDFPDPTAMRIGPEYWAIATASSGRPSPPILRSPDLVHWSVAGNLFTEPPAWSSGRQLWGPWLVRDGDQYRVYYSARRKYGSPCITVGVADGPLGPYSDRGPLVCQRHASIDPSVVHNADNWPFLVWKENGETKPSSIWTQPLGLDGLRMTGTRHKILVGKRDSWEGGLVEGPRIIRRHQWLYLFYSGGHCCAPSDCRYALGVARAHGIYGPWRRSPHNPILKSNKHWKCPGHGAVLQSPSGHWWLLYNGYRANGPPDRGREMLLDLIRWSRDDWPVIQPSS
ncbi:MAG: glycoside hydrolase family 43 protein [Thermoleophilaceae bacterium]